TRTMPRHITAVAPVCQPVGQGDGPADVLDAEGRVACREIGVGEGAGHVNRIEMVVEYVDAACMEVARVQEVAGGGVVDGEPLVHRSGRQVIHGDHHGNSSKSRDSAVLAREDEAGRARACTVVHDKAAAAVEYDTGRRAV